MARDKEAQEVPEEFWEAVDQFLELANRQAQELPVPRVSAAIMYAAARYNAFNAVLQDPALAEDAEEAIDYFCRQYRDMFKENLRSHLSEESD